MKIKDTLKLSVRALNRQRTRTFLTSFAVFIGIFLIVFMVSASIGGKELLISQFTNSFDLNQVIVAAKGNLEFNFAAPSVDEEEVIPLTQEKVDEILALENVIDVQPIVVLTPRTLELEGQEDPISNVFGSGMDLRPTDKYVQDVPAGEVRYLQSDEVIISTQVTSAYEIDPSEVIGKTLTLTEDNSSFFTTKVKQTGESEEFTIVGVIDVGQDQNNFVFSVDKAISILVESGGFDSKEDYLSEIGYDQVLVQARDEEVVDDVAQQIKDIGFDATTIDELLDLFGTVTTIVQIVFSMFGVIALVVSSIGIINTMIMSVYERTREIGVMKAIGANKKDIRSLFLTEAAIIGLLGGLLGLGIALGVMAITENILINQVFPAQNIDLDNVFTTPIWLIIAPVVFSTVVGMLAGVYPAIRASKLEPVDALRYE